MSWSLVLALGAATIALKGAGPVLLGERELPGALRAALSLIGPVMLGALVAVNTFGDGRALVLDERAAGVAAAALALALRAPLVVVVLLAAVVTAGLRAL